MTTNAIGEIDTPTRTFPKISPLDPDRTTAGLGTGVVPSARGAGTSTARRRNPPTRRRGPGPTVPSVQPDETPPDEASLIAIRPERESDHDAIARVVAAAFRSPAEADLVERIRRSPEYVAEMALVAVATELDAIVGHVMISGATLRLPSGHDRAVVMLSPLAVAPDHHGQGIGGALVRAAVAVADERGEPFVVLEGSPAYYRRFGFGPASAHGITLPLPDWAPTDAAQLVPLRNDDPTLTGTVIYPAAFDDLS